MATALITTALSATALSATAHRKRANSERLELAAELQPFAVPAKRR
jgi:hypothetical protein